MQARTTQHAPPRPRPGPLSHRSPESQVRDLQFKSLMTTIMVMSGWAANPDKQPWTWGEPCTTYNRASL